jgi:hypothetical protein
MPESTRIIVSRRNIRHNLHSTATDRQPVLFLRGPGDIARSGFEALLRGPGRVFYLAPDLVDANQPPVLIETEGTVLLDGDEPGSETGSGLIKRVYIHQQHLLKNHKGARLPPISIHTSRGVTPCFEARVLGPSLIVYSHGKPQPCGARVWLETREPIMADGVWIAERAL